MEGSARRAADREDAAPASAGSATVERDPATKGAAPEPADLASASDAPLAPDQLLLIYDGQCGVCSRIAARMLLMDRHRRAAWMPSQRAGLAEAAGLTAEEVESAAWAVTRSGKRLRGPAAMLAGLDAVLLAGHGHLAALHRVPVLRGILDAGYNWLARNRGRFRGTAVCDVRPPEPLDQASCDELAARGRRGGWTPLPEGGGTAT